MLRERKNERKGRAEHGRRRLKLKHHPEDSRSSLRRGLRPRDRLRCATVWKSRSRPLLVHRRHNASFSFSLLSINSFEVFSAFNSSNLPCRDQDKTLGIEESLELVGCPHRLRLSHVQDLDADALFPVIQWLTSHLPQNQEHRASEVLDYCLQWSKFWFW